VSINSGEGHPEINKNAWGYLSLLVEVIWEKRENYFPYKKIASPNLALFD
jgi:hypothetical protein